ncbi:MAG: Hsp20/alpha crystallin family protein [Pseudomonadota bacterium]|nr:Hsp20/alpha crystallin family protein [Pseudomonadota bacterium]
MAVRDLIPWGRSSTSAPTRYGEEVSPFLTLRREMDRLFDEAFRGFEGLPGFPGAAGRSLSWPTLEVSETDQEIKVAAEVPGLEEKDVEVLLAEGMLTIRGEKKSETEDKERQFSERFYGRFERRLALPAEVEQDKVEASFKNGVLTVTLPKSAKAQQHVKRIPVNKAGT